MTREEAIDLVIKVFDTLEGECNIEYDWSKEHNARDMAIKALGQEPKTGHWIKDDITERSKSAYKHKCDRCGAYHRAMYDYCPSCGAKMVEPQESEGAE